MSTRAPLSNLPLSRFVPASSSTSSPSKQTPLRQSALAMSLLPSPFLAATTPRAPTSAGPLSTLYERETPRGASPVSRATTRSRTPSSRLIDQEEQLEQQLDGDDISVSATPPKRLLDMFIQSAEKDKGHNSTSSDRVSLPRKEEEGEATAPIPWDFYFDEDLSQPPQPRLPHAESGTATPDSTITTEPEAEEELQVESDAKENVRLPPRRFRSSTSTSLSSLRPSEVVSAPASLNGSANPSPNRPTPAPVSFPSRASTSFSSASSWPNVSSRTPTETSPPPVTPDLVPHSPTYPPSSPPLNPNDAIEEGAITAIRGFAEGAVGSFETSLEEHPSLDGLGLNIGRTELESAHNELGISETCGRRGRKRLSDENEQSKQKKVKPELEP